MSWSNQDNPNYRGTIDRIFVSETEYWELHYFVDHYLKTNSFDVTDSNRSIVREAIKTYPGRAPIKRTDLTVFLNGKFKQ